MGTLQRQSATFKMASGTCLEPFLNFEDFSKDFQQVIHYLQKQKKVMDAHMVEFFSESHWESLLPLKMREDLEPLSSEELASLPTAFEGESEILRKCGGSLKQFLTEASQNQLKSFSWLKGKQGFLSHDKVQFVSHIMNPKKSYEVEVMSDVINTLATQFHVRQVSTFFSFIYTHYITFTLSQIKIYTYQLPLLAHS